jgi:hypothetical protein
MNKVKRYVDSGIAGLSENSDGEWVRFTDYQELMDYADRLAEGLPCLPKDVEVLRSANLTLALENHKFREMLGISL